MESRGFEKRQRHGVHPKNPFWVEFLGGPIAIGDEVIDEFAEWQSGAGLLRMLDPTECVMDRLTGFIHSADRQCLDQAVRVATRQPVKHKRIEKWAREEGPRGLERYREFKRLLGRSAEE